MFAVEIWSPLPNGGWTYDVVKATRIRVNRIDEDGHAVLMTSVSDWEDAE